MNRRLFTAFGAVLLIVASTLPMSVGAASGKAGSLGFDAGQKTNFRKTGIYIVQLADRPVVAYDGGIKGLAATKPAKGSKIDPTSSGVTKYASYLTGKHDAALAAVGAGHKLYSYVYSYNGFAALLTPAQANSLSALDGVVSVNRDALHDVDTSSTPSFLGLDAEGGLWNQLGGFGHAGEDVVIGVVDSGIWPEALSFSDRVDANGLPSNAPGAKRAYQQLPGWHGKCTNGEAFSATNCNQKLIGAQYFNAAWADVGAGLTANQTLNRDRPWEFLSPRDYNSHGTHTSSTAGGNHGVAATGPASVFGSISGMAPRARIAMYKALWSTRDGATASGFTSDLVEAIDQAVADGVDVINYSISGTTTNFADPVEISFLFAADAGIFVAESAGNSGPTTGTVAHPGPWTTTVAAGTHNRDGLGSVTLGNGVTYTGKSVATAVGPVPLIDSTAAGLPGADPALVDLCYGAGNNPVGDPAVPTPVLDPAKVAGKIVICHRGVIARVDKSKAVLEAGGVGMIMYNDPDSSTNADFHYVPTVHVDKASGLAIKAYAATAGATATINQATIVYNAAAPVTASFSSRGPLAAGGGDLLKPDIIAPGQDILAAVSPSIAGRSFDLLSGTSMSSPHAAGLGALLKDLHPNWSPMAIKSALMTSGSDVLDGPNTNPLVIFRQGAGHVRPNGAADPGLVYDSGFLDWLAFLCGTTSAVGPGTCAALVGLGFSTDASDFNGASIAIGDLVGSQTVHRIVTNVGSTAATYTASVTGMAGINVNVSPASFTLNPGDSQGFTVTFFRTTATLGAYTGGQLTWSDGTHNVRSPLVIKPVAIAAPPEVSGTPAGFTYNIKTGFDGTLTFGARGLVAANASAQTVAQDPNQSFNVNDPTGTVKVDFVVPAGLSLLRLGIAESDITPSGTDLDVYVYRGGVQVGAASDGDSNEMVTFVAPVAGTYSIYIHGFSTNGPSADFTLFEWEVPTTSSGNMTVPSPTAVTNGGTVAVPLSFTGLTAGTWYLGQVTYQNPAGTVIGSTIVNVR
jgi:subtilisin family serine protease